MSRLRAQTVSQIPVISNSATRDPEFSGLRHSVRPYSLEPCTHGGKRGWEAASTRSECGDMIQQRNAGKSGLRVSAIGLGCNFGRSPSRHADSTIQGQQQAANGVLLVASQVVRIS
jgi:hypothetical protein